MKLYNIKDIKNFSHVIDACEGNVMMVSPSGDQLNLKSKLTQLLVLSETLGAGETPISEMEVVAENPMDVVRIMDYMISA